MARDGHVSKRSRAGRSKHDVCDCKPNPRWPKTSKTIVKRNSLFFYLQNPVKQNFDLKRSERRPTGGKVARDGHVSERSRAGRSKHDVCDCKPNPRWPTTRICNFKIVNPFFMSFSTKCVIIKQNKEVQNAIRSFGKTD